MLGWPEPRSLERKHAITMIRLSFQPSAPIHRLKVDRTPLTREWKSTISLIKRQAGWRYINLGNEPENPAQALIIIGWLDSTAPSPLFTPGRGVEDGPILPHLNPHLSQPPEVITLWHADDRARRTHVATVFSPHRRPPTPPLHEGGIAEFVRLRGPAAALEVAVKDIALNIDYFNVERFPVLEGNISHNFLFSGGIPFAAEDHQDYLEDGTGRDAEDRSEVATLAFIFWWAGKDYRDEFRDPNVLDRGACSHLDDDFSRTFWRDNVEGPMKKLQDEHEVQVTSWDYEAHTPVAYNDAQATFDDGYGF